ncbi:hypothetical protein JHK87_008961 [Glycine soja]|nr:hypothetical protein JHK87_008961 [Glycine soja]
MGFDISKPGLRLGLGLHDDHSSENCMMKTNEQRQRQRQRQSQKKKEADPCNKAYPSLKLGPPDDEANNNNQQITNIESDEYYYFHPHASSRSPSAVSSFSNSSSIIKREREQLELEVEKISLSRDFVEVDENGNPKKKLRLTKEQSAVLEDSFKEHYTISPKQKQELAKKLNLRTRQVEVWFQNRRARTKLKQTEVERELLKKCCETLTEENKMLEKELQELKSTKTSMGPFYMQLPVESLRICPSCERISGGNNGSSPTTALLEAPKAHKDQPFYKNNYTFTQSSAAFAS